MSEKPPEDISKERLWNELQELKSHVYPNRRQAMKGMATAAGAGMLGFSAGNASAQASSSDSDGNVGTDTDRVDVFADGVDVGSEVVWPDGYTTKTSPGGGGTYYSSDYGSDGAAIQSALNEASGSEWSRVVIDPIDTDPYVVSNPSLDVSPKTVVEVREDVKLGGSVDNPLFRNTGYDDETTFDEHIHIVGKGGVLDGNRANNSSSLSVGNERDLILLGSVRHVRVESVQIKECAHFGIKIQGGHDVTLTNNTVINSGRGNVVCQPSKPNNTNVNKRVRITGNSTDGAYLDAGSGKAVYLQAFEDAIIDNNTVSNSQSGGIGLDTEDMGHASSNGVILDNTVRGTTEWGILCDSRNTGSITNLVIGGNTVDTTGSADAEAAGIQVWAGRQATNADSTPIRDFTIAENTIQAAARGIVLTGAPEGKPRDGRVAGNVIDAGGRGIFGNDLNDSDVAANTVKQSGGAGLYFNANDYTEDINIRDNDCWDCGGNNTGATASGIYIDGVATGLVKGNTSGNKDTTNQAYGIYSTSGSSGLVVITNDLRNNGTAGHSLNGTSPITDAVGQGTAEDWNIT